MGVQGFSGNTIHQSIILGLVQWLSFAESVLDSESPLSDVLHKKKISRRLIMVAFQNREMGALGLPQNADSYWRMMSWLPILRDHFHPGIATLKGSGKTLQT